jgi:antitoxin Phd
MSTLKMSEFRAKLLAAIETAQSEAVTVMRGRKPAAVLVSPERYEELMDALEERDDIAAVDAALAEGGEPIPWDQVMRDLGWTT